MPLFDRIESHASQDRLERLIEERLAPGADTQAIDKVIWKLFGERWAVMFTGLIGFSRKVAEFGILQFLQTIHISHRLLVPCLERGAGILLKTEDTAKAGEILLTAAVYEAAMKDGFEGFDSLAVAPPGTHAAYRLQYRV